MPEAADEIPVNPNKAAINATTKKIIAHRKSPIATSVQKMNFFIPS